MADNAKVYAMRFGKDWPMLVNKALRKGRSEDEVYEVASWLTGYSRAQIDELAAGDACYAEFFNNAPAMNPKRELITGSVCGVRVQDVEEPLMRQIRQLDKLVDELAKGKPLEKILRS